MGLDYGIIFWFPITMILALSFGSYGKKKTLPRPYYLILGLGIIYINFMIAFAFFPMHFMPNLEISIEYCITWIIDFHNQDINQLILNIILTIPLGLGIQFVTNLKNVQRFILVLGLSVSIEILQLFIIVAFRPVDLIFDMTDVLCNGLGGCIGYGTVFLFNSLFKESSARNTSSFFGYIAQVCKNCANGKQSLL